MRSATAISQRRACRLVGLSRSVYHFRSAKQTEDQVLKSRLVTLANEHRRFGYRRLHMLLRRKGIEVNHKRIYRLYSEASLGVKRRKKRKGVSVERKPLVLPTAANETWSMDFVMDALSDGRRIKILTVVDDYTKESLSLTVAYSIGGEQVVELLEMIVLFRGYPKAIRTDQGPEFTSKALDQWAYRHGVQAIVIQAGKPTQNAYIESFNGKFRDECLNEHWFTSIAHAREIIRQWRDDYNQTRPHSALSYLTPSEFAAIQREDNHSQKVI